MQDPADQIIDLYERHAHEYVADRGRRLAGERAWLDRFMALLPPGATILDIGCGSGEPIARDLIDHGFAVEGIDASPTLISVCRDRFPDQAWQVADMRTLALGRQFQGVLAWDSFFHLRGDDQRRMFGIFQQHAAPGAALMFTSGSDEGEAMGSYHGETLYHASLATETYRELLAGIGFRVVKHTVDDADCGHHTVWLAQTT